MTKAQKQIALQFNEYINNRNIDGLATLMTDDHAFIDTANVEFRGKKRALEAWRGFFEAFPEYKNIFEQVLIKDDRVIMIGHSVCPSNEALDGPAIWTAKIKDGQVSKWRVYENTPSNRASLDVA
jgi:ketosteroid isomerase-like protein